MQVYLERVPGATTGCIKWRINFGCCGLLVDEVTVRLSCVEDHGGEVVATLMGTPGQKRVRYPIGEAQSYADMCQTLQYLKKRKNEPLPYCFLPLFQIFYMEMGFVCGTINIQDNLISI